MKPISILIVEDEMIAAASLALDLQRSGYQVAGIAVSGTQALQKISALKPDLILMDILIKGEMDGIQLVKQFVMNVILLLSI